MMVVCVHGGVSGLVKRDLPDLGYAAEAGAARTRALDAVEAAVVSLEDDPRLNAGWGAVLDRAGSLALDAGIVDGSTGKVGGVAGVQVRHPVVIARRVLERTPHVLMFGPGAMALSEGLERLDGSTPEQRERWERARADGALEDTSFGAPEQVDTVGAVALDEEGNLAAASSTGGVFGKLPGRVGDAPILGAGLYATETAAVVGTGVGELFLQTLAAARAGGLIERGAPPQEACEETIARLGGSPDLAGGLLALDVHGNAGAAYRGGSFPMTSVATSLVATKVGSPETER